MDSYWNSPFSYWVTKSMRVDPPVPLRLRVVGAVIRSSHEGWINYGGPWAMLVQSVQAYGHSGQQIRMEVSDEVVHQTPVDD